MSHQYQDHAYSHVYTFNSTGSQKCASVLVDKYLVCMIYTCNVDDVFGILYKNMALYTV